MRISDWSSYVCSSDLRELTVDTSNQELRLHDGVTPGGHRFLNRDSNDQRYQAKSSELDGFNGCAPSDRGDRKSVVSGKSVSVRVDRGGSRSIKKKKTTIHTTYKKRVIRN